MFFVVNPCVSNCRLQFVVNPCIETIAQVDNDFWANTSSYISSTLVGEIKENYLFHRKYMILPYIGADYLNPFSSLRYAKWFFEGVKLNVALSQIKKDLGEKFVYVSHNC